MKKYDSLLKIFNTLPYPVFAKNAQNEWIYGKAGT